MQGVQVVELLDDSPVKPQSEKSFTIQAGMKKPEPKRKQSINNEFREIFGSDSNSGTFPFHSQTISFTISDTKVREMKAADFGTDSTFPGAPIKFYNLTAKPGCKFTYSSESDDENETAMKAEKDDTLSTEVPSYTNSTQNGEHDIMDSSKTIETRRARLGKPCHEVSCGNYNCTITKKYRNKSKFQFMNYPDETPKEYCGDCAEAISKKWTCPFCDGIYTNFTHSKGEDTFQWIKCDFGRCGRWIHIECELSEGIKEIKALKDSSYKYFCPSCRENGKKMNINKREKLFSTTNYSDSIPKPPGRPSKKGTKRPRRCTDRGSYGAKAQVDTPYQYVFSEHYCTLDKLLNQVGDQIHVTASEANEDLSFIYNKEGFF